MKIGIIIVLYINQLLKFVYLLGSDIDQLFVDVEFDLNELEDDDNCVDLMFLMCLGCGVICQIGCQEIGLFMGYYSILSGLGYVGLVVMILVIL